MTMAKKTKTKTEIRNAKLVETPTATIEQRHFKTVLTRMDGEDETFKIAGEASVFGVEYNMGWYDEIIELGAADSALEKSDARCLFNHDKNLILGRMSAGTLVVTTDGSKLSYECDAPNTSYARDLSISLERGDIAESSFGFTIGKQRWEEHKMEDGRWRDKRYIVEFEQIFDVSPVTYPANPDTSVAKRSFDAWEKEGEKPPIIEDSDDFDFDDEIYKHRLG